MNKSYRLLPVIISLVAGLVVSIMTLINRVNSLKALILVFLFLLIFYIIGLIFRAVLVKFETKPEPKEDKDNQQTEDITTESEEK